METAQYMTLVLGLVGGAAGGQHLWRLGLRAPVIITALGFAALAAMVFMIGYGLKGDLAGAGHMAWSFVLMAGPVGGMVLGMLIGWRRGPVAPSAPHGEADE
jgi:hypothetical protein